MFSSRRCRLIKRSERRLNIPKKFWSAGPDQATMDDHRWWTKETVAVVTGANKGMGYEIVRQLASKDIHVILTSRDEERGVSATKRLHDIGLVNVVFHQLDVQNPTSVAAFGIWMNQHYTKLDILVNNAAMIGVAIDTDILKARGIDPKQIFSSAQSNLRGEGFREDYELAEACIDVNYYGIKRTIEALLPLLKVSNPGGARIVNVSSAAGLLQHIPSETLRQQLSDPDNLTEEKVDSFVKNFLDDFREDKLQSSGWPTKLSAYFVSKAALNAYTRILARQFPNMYINCVHPGFVSTELNFNTGVLSVEEGAEAPVTVALLPPGGPSGQYFNRKEIANF